MPGVSRRDQRTHIKMVHDTGSRTGDLWLKRKGEMKEERTGIELV